MGYYDFHKLCRRCKHWKRDYLLKDAFACFATEATTYISPDKCSAFKEKIPDAVKLWKKKLNEK